MTLEYSGSSTNEVPGKSTTATVKYKGEYKGLETILTFKASHKNHIHAVVPRVLREIALDIFDPNRKIDEFEPGLDLHEELVLGIPNDGKDVYWSKCNDCGLDIWVYYGETKPLCPECQKELKYEAFKKGQKELIKKKRLNTPTEVFPVDEIVLRLEGEMLEDYDSRKQRIQDAAYQVERIRRVQTEQA